ncbi:hypothetical protein LZ31DRAFT_7125 [Colletotrichum somersetense]|nr:hypothetical protein LZ31DRAFT_7125 [Colletotrichum somersetense]
MSTTTALSSHFLSTIELPSIAEPNPLRPSPLPTLFPPPRQQRNLLGGPETHGCLRSALFCVRALTTQREVPDARPLPCVDTSKNGARNARTMAVNTPKTYWQHQARRQPINSAGRYPHWDDVEAGVPCAAVFAYVFGSETQVQGHSVGP